MPHPYPKPILPVPTPVDQWTAPVGVNLPDGYLSDPRNDLWQRCMLRAIVQVRIDANAFIKANRGKPEAQSAMGFVANLPDLAQLEACKHDFDFEGYSTAALVGRSTAALDLATAPAQFKNMGSMRPAMTEDGIPLPGVAFLGDNELPQGTIPGVQLDEVYDLLFSQLVRDVRSGAYLR